MNISVYKQTLTVTHYYSDPEKSAPQCFSPTVDTTAQDLGPEADGAVGVPGLWVDADETGHGGNRKKSEHRSLWILVPFKYLYSAM